MTLEKIGVFKKVKQFLVDIRDPNSDFRRYMGRDERWLSLVVACSIVSASLAVMAICVNLFMGIGTMQFCIGLIVLAVLFILPGSYMAWRLRNEKLVKTGKVKTPTERKPLLPRFDVKKAFHRNAPTPVEEIDGELFVDTPPIEPMQEPKSSSFAKQDQASDDEIAAILQKHSTPQQPPSDFDMEALVKQYANHYKTQKDD